MNSLERSARWAVENPTIARGQLLTAARNLSTAVQATSILLGVLDLAPTNDDTAHAAERHLLLGMNEIHRELLHAVHALNLADTESSGGPFAPAPGSSRLFCR